VTQVTNVSDEPTARENRFASNLARGLFSLRPLILLLFALITLWLGWQARDLRADAGFEKLIPTDHPYIVNFLKHREALGGLSNVVRVVVVSKKGSILDTEFLNTLKNITDDVFYIDGIDRGNMRSLWTPNARWMSVTAEGFTGGPIIPRDYDGSESSLEQVEQNIRRSREIGLTVSNNFESTLLQAPLLPKTADGEPLDYAELSSKLEELRDKYQSDSVEIRVVAIFFVIAVLIMGALLLLYTHSLIATLLAVGCSAIAVLWQLGMLTWLGYGLDPYSILVPFLIFAIGTSHAIQIISAVALNENEGQTARKAAEHAFGRLVLPGGAALFSDSIGFLTLVVIPIAVIAELAIAAGLGVAMVLLTNLLLLPLLLSITGVGKKAVRLAGHKSVISTKVHRNCARTAVTIKMSPISVITMQPPLMCLLSCPRPNPVAA